jgi:peptidyl-dipeptidase Dcp
MSKPIGCDAQHPFASKRERMPEQQNPLLQTWSTPYGAPPFGEVNPDHFAPAFEATMQEHREELDAIAGATEPATFANTIVALEASGRRLEQVCRVFFNLTSANTNPALQTIQRDVAPKLAHHESQMYQNSDLFQRINTVFQNRASLNLKPEEDRVLERTHVAFVRNGALLNEEKKKRLGDIFSNLATLATQFSQNVLKDEQDWQLVLREDSELQGLPAGVIASAKMAAQDRGIDDGHVITLQRSSIVPFLQFSARRDLRETAYKAWTSRGANSGGTDNRGILKDIVALRNEVADIMGHESYAAYAIDDQMAKTPDNVRGLLDAVWQPALSRSKEERRALNALVRDGGENFTVEAWDWRFYSERERARKFNIDTAEVRPYLALDSIIEAAFHTANQLFGLQFEEVSGVPAPHADVRVWDVKDIKGKHVGLFMGDYFARSSKQSGAWMSSYRGQQRLTGDVRPIVVNTMNFAKAPEGQPTLLSFDDARTLFHEFGHGLHGLLSDVTFPSLAGTSVARDFVELPSQLFEHWLLQPEILKEFARHAETDQPMPDDLIARIQASDTFNQGFDTVEYVASALADLELHTSDTAADMDIEIFEAELLGGINMPPEIGMRHRLTHFGHIVGGYAAGYYSYLWSEVMDADAFEAFREAGDIFHPETAARLKSYIYSAGNSRDPEQAYKLFRGRDPSVAGLLKKRGLDAA